MITPMRGKIVVLPNERVTETESGLYAGDHYNPELGMRRGRVVSVGNGVREVKVGDEACFMAFSGLAIEFEGTRYLTMHEDEVIAIGVG